MEVYYGIGENNGICCLISTNRGEELYDIGELSTRPAENQKERRLELLKIVSTNGPIHHTHVVKLAQELCSIAKRTIEKELNNLEEDGLIESEKEGKKYSNGSRLWSIKTPEFDFEKHAKKEAKNIITTMERYVKSLEKNYEKLNSVMKDHAMVNLLDILHSWQPIIEIINQDVKIKNEKKKFDSLVNRAYQILQHENRDHIDGRPSLRRLLHLKSSESMITMNDFLEEIK